MKILVPTDFSENADHALDYAIQLALAYKAELLLYHFVSVPIYSSDAPVVLPSESELKSQSMEAIDEMIAAYRKKYPSLKIRSDVHASINFPEDAIVNEEFTSHCDLVVMGTKGRGSAMSKLLGSNSATVIEGSQCPVIVVPVDSKLSVPKHVAMAVNYGETDHENALTLIELMKPFNAKITIIHVADKKEDPSHADTEIRMLADHLRTTGNYPHIYADVIYSDDTYKGLTEWLKIGRADLLVMSMRKRTLSDKLFRTSMTRKVLFHTHLPLMTFHTD